MYLENGETIIGNSKERAAESKSLSDRRHTLDSFVTENIGYGYVGHLSIKSTFIDVERSGDTFFALGVENVLHARGVEFTCLNSDWYPLRRLFHIYSKVCEPERFAVAVSIGKGKRQ